MPKQLKLAGVHEAAEILGISKATLADRRRHGGRRRLHTQPEFPKPLAELRSGPVWDADELRAYRRRYERHAFNRLGARTD